MSGRAIEPNWFSVTTLAVSDWNAAIKAHWDGFYAWRDDRDEYDRSLHRLALARAEYRRRVLGWFWKLVAPIGPGQCIPNEVAKLLAEQWDEDTREQAAP